MDEAGKVQRVNDVREAIVAAVKDFVDPSLLVMGGDDSASVERVAGLYSPLGVKACLVSLRTAEMIKYACNAFHAVKISFANEVGACGVIAGDDPAGIAQVRRECEIELIAMIDFVDRHQRALAHLAGHHGVRSRLGKYEAERDGRLGHEEARALCGNNFLARK